MMKNILENLGIDGVFVHTYHATYVRMIFFYVTRMRMRGKRGKKMKNVIENERMKWKKVVVASVDEVGWLSGFFFYSICFECFTLFCVKHEFVDKKKLRKICSLLDFKKNETKSDKKITRFLNLQSKPANFDKISKVKFLEFEFLNFFEHVLSSFDRKFWKSLIKLLIIKKKVLEFSKLVQKWTKNSDLVF